MKTEVIRYHPLAIMCLPIQGNEESEAPSSRKFRQTSISYEDNRKQRSFEFNCA
jgi:hypothetical protein